MMERHYLTYVLSLMLFFIILKTASVKVSIKSNSGDWCIRVKGFHPTVEKCHWNQSIHGTLVEHSGQIFDIHPADVDEEMSSPNSKGARATFLIRLTERPAATSCLSFISPSLTVEKCSLKKSQFRLAGSFLPKLHSNFCNQTNPPHKDIRYKLYSLDQQCLELITLSPEKEKSGSNGNHALVVTKCATEKEVSHAGTRKTFQLWQFCVDNENCSLSPFELGWSSLIKLEPPVGADVTKCKESEASTTTTSIITNSSMPDKANNDDDPLENPQNFTNGTNCNFGSGLVLHSPTILHLSFVYFVILSIH